MTHRALSQGNLVIGSNSQTAVFNPVTKTDSFPTDKDSSIPRTKPLSESCYGFSPQKQEPAPVLDLSEPEIDFVTRAEQVSVEPADGSVVVVDALYQKIAPNLAEVSVRETIGRSPYKVVCHSPRAAKQSLFKQTSASGPTRVNVSNVPSMELIHRVKDIMTEDDEDPVSLSAKKLPPCPLSPESVGTESSCNLQISDDAIVRLQDTEDTELDKEDPLEATNNVTLRKKKKRIVASRIKAATASYNAKAVKQQSQQNSYRSMLQKSKPGSNKKPVLSNKVNITPSTKPEKSRRQASTPENITIAPNESFDVSALQTTRAVNVMLNETESFYAPTDQSTEGKTRSTKITKKTCSVTPDNITQDVIDVQYARYLQWLFLSSKTQKSIIDEEKEVTKQLQLLWMENRRMKLKLSQLDQEYDRLQHTTDLEEMLDVQKSLLSSIIHELPTLSQYYQNMAEALDTTRHELQTEGINIPENKVEQQEFEEALLTALDESEQLLAQIATRTRRNVSTTSQYAQAIDALANTVIDEEKQIVKCQELVKAAQTLSNHENSLRIQQKELSEPCML